MTRFEWFENGYAQSALNLGILSPNLFMYFIRYKRFLDVRPKANTQADAMAIVAEEFKCSESSVFRAVSFFRNP